MSAGKRSPRIWNKEFFDTRGLSGNVYSIQESILLAERSKAKRIISGTVFQQPDHDVSTVSSLPFLLFLGLKIGLSRYSEIRIL